MKERVGVIFTNDLRLEDNRVLESAIQSGSEISAFYLFDKDEIFSEEMGIRRLGPYRSQFLIESLECLQKNIEKKGGKLHIIDSENGDELLEVCKKYEIEKLSIKKSVGTYEQKNIRILAEKMAEDGIVLSQVWDNTLIDLDNLPFSLDDIPQVFTHFRKAVEKQCDISEPKVLADGVQFSKFPVGIDLSLKDFGYTDDDAVQDERGVLIFKGGEDTAGERLAHYLWETESLSNYKETRNGLIGANYSSKFSCWINTGCISPRQIYNEIQVYETEVKKNSSTYWLVFELLWRDFFQFIFLQNPVKFWSNYRSGEAIDVSESDKRKFQKWKDSKLGVAFVDANMRELKETGFMSNRGRQNVASYLVNDLKVDWRLGALYFEKMLVDYDVASNWGNWAYQAGVGNDPRDNRYFNIEKQQSMYDSDGKYRKLWQN